MHPPLHPPARPLSVWAPQELPAREKRFVRNPKGGSGLQVGERKRVLKIQQRLHGPRRWLSRWRVSAATWAPADGTRGSPPCAPRPGLGGVSRGWVEVGRKVLECGVWGKSRVSPAGSLPSEPQGTPSTVWVLQGDEGKPQLRVDVLGKGSQAKNHSLTLPEVCVWGEMSQLSPAQFCPDPTSCIPAVLGHTSSVLEMPQQHRHSSLSVD